MQPADEAAFREFVTARSGSLLRTAYLLTGDHGLAEDAVQAMFGRVYLSWTKIRERDATEAYCRTALLREVMSWRRRRQVKHVLTADLPDVGTPPIEPIASAEALRTALDTLSPRQRACVVLRYFDDMSEADVAVALGISAGSVKQHTHRALAALRLALAKDADLIEETGR